MQMMTPLFPMTVTTVLPITVMSLWFLFLFKKIHVAVSLTHLTNVNESFLAARHFIVFIYDYPLDHVVQFVDPLVLKKPLLLVIQVWPGPFKKTQVALSATRNGYVVSVTELRSIIGKRSRKIFE